MRHPSATWLINTCESKLKQLEARKHTIKTDYHVGFVDNSYLRDKSLGPYYFVYVIEETELFETSSTLATIDMYHPNHVIWEQAPTRKEREIINRFFKQLKRNYRLDPTY